MAVVRDLDLRVERGEVVALIGPNGAGKTTALLTLSGELPPIAGEVRFNGEPTTAPLFKRARRGLGFVTEERSVFMRLSTADNLRLARVPRRDATALFPELEPLMGRSTGLLSGGEQQMLALARALMSAPRILLIDEPSVGLAPLLVSRTIDKIKELKEGYNLSVLMAEQNFIQAIRIADRGYVIVHGKIAFEGESAEALNNNELIREFYLGA
jgi:branched-chain amino acid transport system ATP-binding protein